MSMDCVVLTQLDWSGLKRSQEEENVYRSKELRNTYSVYFIFIFFSSRFELYDKCQSYLNVVYP